MAQRIEVQLGIKADTSAAKKSIQDLESSLSNLYKAQRTRGFEDFGINQAVKSAKELELCLSKALNQSTGKLDISAFQKQLKSAGTSMDELNRKLLSGGAAGQQVFSSLAQSIAQAEIPLKKTSKLAQDFTRSIKNVFQYQFSSAIFQGITSSISDAVSYTKTLNASLNDIRIVTGQSAEQMAKFAVEANKSAQKLSTTTNNYAKASLIFYQQGLGDKEVKQRTDAVIKMANVTKENMEDVSSYMTAVWNNFDDGTKSLEHYADVMTALGAATASSTKEIAAGLEKFASIGKTIGLSYDYATSALATIVSQTRQSADTVGTGLRTIFSRLQGLSLGETLEDGVDLNKYSQALNKVGVSVLDASGGMKEMDAILDSLASKWTNLSTAQKTALAQTVGGVRQYTTLISLMDNWDSMKSNLNVAKNSEGALQKQSDIYAESWEAASARSKAALEELYATLLNDKGFIAITNGLTGVTKAVTGLVSAMGGLPGLLGTVGMIATKVFSKQLAGGLNNTVQNLTSWVSQFKGQGVGKSIGMILSGKSQSGAQVRANQAFAEQERSYDTVMANLSARGKKDSAEYLVASQAKTLIGRKRRLMSRSSYMSEEEQVMVQDKLNQLAEAQARRADLKREQEEQDAEAQELTKKLLQANVSRTYVSEKDGKEKTRSKEDQIRHLLYASGIETLAKKSKYKTPEEYFQKEILDKARESSWRQSMADSMKKNDLSTAEGRKTTIRDMNRTFGKGTIGADADETAIRAKLDELSKEAEEARKKIDEVVKTATSGSEDLSGAKAQVQDLVSEASEQGEKQASRTKEENVVEGMMEDAQGGLDKLLDSDFTDNLKGGLEQAGAAIGGITAGFSAAAAAAETFGDVTATAGDKAGAAMSLVSGAVTAFATGGWVGGAAYAIGVVSSQIYTAIDNAYHAEERAAEEAEESAARLQENYQNLQAEYDDLISTMENFENASDTLDSLVIGTDAWKQSLIEANEAALRLIESFGLIKGEDYTVNANGQIQFTKAGQTKIDESQSQKLTDTIVAQSAAQVAQAEAAKMRAEADKDVAVKANDKGRWATAIHNGIGGASIGTAGFASGPIVGAITTLLGGATGFLAGLANYDSKMEGINQAEKDKVDKITETYRQNRNDVELSQMIKTQFEDESGSYRQSIMNVVKATIDAETQFANAMELAAKASLNANETYQNIKNEDVKEDVAGRATKAWTAAKNKADTQYDFDVQNEATAKEYAQAYLSTLKKKDAIIGGQTDNGNFTYTYLDENNQRVSAEMTAGEIKTHTTTAKADAALSSSLSSMIDVFTDLEAGAAEFRDGKTASLAEQRALAAFGAGDLKQATLEEFKALGSADLKKLTDEQLAAMGFESYEDAKKAYNKLDDEAIAAWDNIAKNLKGVFSETDLVDKMTAVTAKEFSNTVKALSSGPIEDVGAQLNTALLTAFDEANVLEKDKTNILAQLSTIDWTTEGAFDTFIATFEEFGYLIDGTQEHWQNFATTMQQAGRIIPDFSQLKTNLNNVSKIVSGLKLGEAVSEKDYETLIKYNAAWKELFVLQADGSRKFIGDTKQMTQAVKDMAEKSKADLDAQKALSQNESVMNFSWMNAGATSSAEEFQELWSKNKDVQEMLAKYGYDEADITRYVEEAKAGKTTGLQNIYDTIQKLIDPAQIQNATIEIEEMVASFAKTVPELQELLSEGLISDDTYSKSLVAMASGYEYCTTAIKDYQTALANKDKDQEAFEQAKDNLENLIELEQKAEKTESAFTHALSGRKNLSVKELATLKEENEELYNSFLTSSDEQWYEMSYQAYSAWLSNRIAGYSEDQAEYKALMAEKQQIDEEYYNKNAEKNEQAYNDFMSNWKEENQSYKSAIDALSIFDEGKTYGEQSFEAIEKLRQSLLETGKTGEEVDQILKNLGKDNKMTDVETIWAATREKARLLLSQAVNNQDAQQIASIDTEIQVVVVGAKSNVPNVIVTDEGAQIPGKDTVVNATVVDQGLSSGSTQKSVLTTDANGQLVVKTGEKEVPFSVYATDDTGAFTSGALEYDKDGVYINVKDPETGKEIKVYINDDDATFDSGVIVDTGEGYGVQWSTKTGQTFTATLSSLLFNSKGVLTSTSKGWTVEFTGKNGRIYTATLASLLNNKNSVVSHTKDGWTVAWTGSDGKKYTATLSGVDNSSTLKGLEYDAAAKGWKITFTDKTGEMFTASLGADFDTNSTWKQYLEFDEKKGFSLKMKNGEVIPVSLDETTLAKLAEEGGSFIKYKEGVGFYVETEAAVITIKPELDLEGTGFELHAGKLRYGDGKIVGNNGEVIVQNTDGSMTIYDDNGNVIDTLNSEQAASASGGTLYGDKLKTVAKDEDDNYVFDQDSSFINNASAMTAKELMEWLGVTDALTLGRNIFRTENYLANLEDDETLLEDLSERRSTGMSLLTDWDYAHMLNVLFENAVDTSEWSSFARPLLQTVGASNIYSHVDSNNNGLIDDYKNINILDMVKQIYNDGSFMSDLQDYIENYDYSDLKNSLLTDNNTIDPAFQNYFGGMLEALAANSEYADAFFEQLFSTSENQSEEVRKQGYFVAQGLLLSCSETLGKDHSITQALEALLAAMNNTLGIASPSRRTMEMGRWLAKGLEEGATQEDIDLSPMAEKALKSISNYLKTNKGKITNELSVFSEDEKEKLKLQYVQEKMNSGEMLQNNEDELFKAWLQDKQLEQAGLAIHKKGDGYQIFSDGKAIEGVFETYEAALTEAINDIYTEKALTQYFNNAIDDNFLQYQEDNSLNAVQKGLIKNLLSETLKLAFKDTNVQYTDWQSLVNAIGFDKAMEYLEKSYSNHNVQFLNDSAMVWAQFKDLMVDAVSQQVEVEDEAAKEVVDIWTKAFDSILKARKAMLEGKSFSEALSNDELKSMISLYAAQGMSPADIRAAMFKTEGQMLPQFEMIYNNKDSRSLIDSALSYDANGYITSSTLIQDSAGKLIPNTSYDAFVANLTSAVASKIDANTDYTDLMTNQAFLTAISAKEVNMEEVYKAARAVNKDFTDDEIEMIASAYTKKDEKGMAVYEGSSAAELAAAYINRVYPDLMKTYQSAVESRIAQDLTHQKTILTSAKESGESYINTQQEKVDLVSKARDALLKGEELKYALTQEEQKELLKVTGASNLTAVSLNTLDTASTTLTNTMVQCAALLAQAMGMIERGEATGFSIDPKTGMVTAFRSRTAAEIAAVTTTDLSNLGVEERNGKYYEKGSSYEITAESDKVGWEAIQKIVKAAAAETVPVTLAGDPSKNTGETIENAQTADKTNNEAMQLQYAQAAGFSSLQEQDDYIKSMEAQRNDKEFNDGGMLTAEEIMNSSLTDEIDTLEKAEALQRKYANQLALSEEGLSELNATGKEWIKTSKKENVSLKEKNKALSSLRKSYQKVLGLTDEQAEALGETFLQNEDNLKLVATAAEKAGEEGAKALNELQFNAAKALDPFDELDTSMDSIIQKLSEIKLDAGAVLPTEFSSMADQYWDGIVNKAVESGASLVEAVTQANNALNSLGIDVEPQFDVVTENVSASTWESLVKQIGTTDMVITDPITGAQTKVTAQNYESLLNEHGGSLPITYVKGKNGKGLNQQQVTSGAPIFRKGAEKTGGGGRSGGGGGSPRRRYLAKAKPEDHKERYHEINNALDEVSDAIERLNKQQDRAWGAERLKSMQAESAELKKQRDLIRQKTDEAKAYLAEDLAKARAAGWTFDADNNVSNYEEHWNALLANYNSEVAKYNAMSAEAQEALEKQVTEANENGMSQYINPETGVAFGGYEEYLKYHFLDSKTEALEQVEETMDELEQLGIDYDDVLNELYDNFIEQVQLKWDTATEIAEINLEWIEHKIGRIEDDAYQAAESIALMGQKVDIAQDKFNAATTALDDLLKGYNETWSAEALMAGKITSQDLANVGMDANAVEMVQEIMHELMEAEQDASEAMVEQFETMTNAFDEFNEDLDRYISTVEHAQNITSTYRNILDLTGKSLGGFSTELLKAFNSATIDQARANMRTNKTKFDTVQAEYDEAYQQYLNEQTLHQQGALNDAALQAAKEAFEATEDNLHEAQEAYVASWEEALQTVADAYTSTMESAIDDISKKLANGLAGGLDALSERFERAKTTDANYVDDYEKIYQLTKLTRDLESQIDNTSNVRAQKELLKFQKEINNILQSDKKLSEYDIDYLQKKYDLKLAEVALEDAQNAKSQVTMRRDSEGNYNYVYTADENAVAEAEAEYATKLYEMQKANDEYISSLSDQIISLEQEMTQALLNLDPTKYANEEEYQAAVKEIVDFYTEQMNYHKEQLQTVLGNNKKLYEEDMVWYNKYANYKMADAKSFIDAWDETLLAQTTGFKSIDDMFETFNAEAQNAQGECITAYRNYVDKINEINAEAGHPTETLAQSLTADIEKMTQVAEQASEDMKTHMETITGEIDAIGSKIEEAAKKYGANITGMAKKTDLLVAALGDTLKLMADFGDYDLEAGILADVEARRKQREAEYAAESFDTGGYTGSWGSDGRLAFLHQKELVLNADDTANMLASVGILRQIANAIDLNALASAGGFISLMSTGVNDNRQTLQQEVHIEASFPNATDKGQIEEAFNDLVNLAAQYSNRIDRSSNF